MAGERTGVFTSWRPGSSTRGLALLTVDAGTDLVSRLPDLVTVPLTAVVTAGQSPPTLPAARCGLGGVAGPGAALVTSRAGHSHRVGAGRAGCGLSDVLRTFLFPGPHRLGPGLHLDPHVLVAGGLAGVSAGEDLLALLTTWRTRPRVTEVLRHLTVVTPGGRRAQLLAARSSDSLLTSARDGDLGLATVTGDAHLELTGIAGARVAPGHALVVLTGESLPTGLLAGRTLARAALLVARMAAAVPQLLALDLAGERLGALNLLRLCSTSENINL